MNDFWSFWYFHIPNFAAAALMYTLIGRIVLGMFVPENWDNYIWRLFKLVTDPFIRLIRRVTPSMLPAGAVMVFGVLWLMTFRVVYLVTLANAGLAPVARPAVS